MSLHFKEINCGFEYGAATVQRYFSDEKRGRVTIGIRSAKGEVQIYITKTGKIRVHSDAGEWLPKKAAKPKKRTKTTE